MNLANETVERLQENGKFIEDVRWVGSRDGTRVISWGDFFTEADCEYDNGFGGTEVSEDLVIVGDDWWLERHEYDGSEWWEYKQLPTMKPDATQVVNVFGSYHGVKRR